MEDEDTQDGCFSWCVIAMRSEGPPVFFIQAGRRLLGRKRRGISNFLS